MISEKGLIPRCSVWTRVSSSWCDLYLCRR